MLFSKTDIGDVDGSVTLALHLIDQSISILTEHVMCNDVICIWRLRGHQQLQPQDLKGFIPIGEIRAIRRLKFSLERYDWLNSPQNK
jgi:hypothetical protein